MPSNTDEAEKCRQFWINFQNAINGQMINPFTGRNISIHNRTFVQLQSRCNSYMIPTLRNNSQPQSQPQSQPDRLSQVQQHITTRYTTLLSRPSPTRYEDILRELDHYIELYRVLISHGSQLQRYNTTWTHIFRISTDISKNIVKLIIKIINHNLTYGNPNDYDAIRMYLTDITELPTGIFNNGVRRSSIILHAITDIRHITFIYPHIDNTNNSSKSKSSISSSSKKSSKNKSNVSSKSYDKEDQLLYCIENLNLKRHKRFTNKLMKICKKYKTPTSHKDTRTLHLLNVLKQSIETNKKLKLNLNINQIIPQLYAKQNILKQLLKTKVNCRDDQGRRIGLKIIFENQQGIDASGLSNQFLQSIKDTLTTNNIFIPIPETPSRYTLNYSITDDEIKSIIGTQASKSDFYKFIGSMVFLLLKNEIGFNFQLSRTLLLQLLFQNKNIDDAELAFYSHEDNSNLNSLISTLNFTPEEANMILLPDNTLKDDNDLLQYMIEQSKQQTNFEHEITKSFINGFHQVSKNLYNIFITNKFTLKDLDNMLQQNDITIDDIINILIPQLTPLTSNSPTLQKSVHTILKNEINFPKEYVTKMKQENPNMPYPENSKEFIEMLLFFWTGKKSIQKPTNDFKYKLIVENTGRREGIIKGQTCSQQLIIDERIGQDITDFQQRTTFLYQNLISTITETGFNID